MPQTTLDADQILKRAKPIDHQKAHEIQPFGHIVKLPWWTCRSCTQTDSLSPITGERS